MRTRSIVRLLAGLMCSFCGCDRAASVATPPPTLSREVLRFPVILVWSGQSAQIKSADNGLKTMHINYLTSERPDPVVIDSDLKIYDMNNLHSTKGGTWMMLNPSGSPPIEFDLSLHAKQGVDAARQLLVDCKWIDTDSDVAESKRNAIATATTLEEMIGIVQGDVK